MWKSIKSKLKLLWLRASDANTIVRWLSGEDNTTRKEKKKEKCQKMFYNDKWSFSVGFFDQAILIGSKLLLPIDLWLFFQQSCKEIAY